MVAVRSGDTVLVHFDVPNTRTRRADKFERLEAFGRALPRIRARVSRDLGKPIDSSLSRTRVRATYGATPSQVTGPKGNREFFLHLRRQI